ncbi:MAG: TonB-dependent receptor, partial [Acidobacteria bacterium]
HIFNPNVLNELRVGYTRFNFVAVEPSNPVLPSSVGFNINPQNPAAAGLPIVAITGFFTLGFTDNGPQPRIDQTYQFTDNFSYQLGRHALKFGFEARRFFVSNPFSFENSGHFGFDGSGTFSTGAAPVDYLLGFPDSYSQSSRGFIDAHAQQVYTYAQDSFKATQNLTLNYGIGWQV